MKILPLNPNTYKQNFKAFCVNGYYPAGKGQYLDEYRELVNSHETYFFRYDINWLAFRDYLNERFSKHPKIDTFVYGCSDGSEPYSLSMVIQSMVDNSDKFFPIKAFDIDEGLILKNNEHKNSAKITYSDFLRMRDLFQKSDKDYSSYVFRDDFDNYYCSYKTTKQVEFKCSNIIEDIKKMNFQNPVLFMCRNMWPYVDPQEYNQFAKSLYSKLPEGSSVVIGDFDYKGNKFFGTNSFPKALLNAGFKQSFSNIGRDIPVKNIVFEKN